MSRRPLVILVCLLTACHTPVGPETSERTCPSSIATMKGGVELLLKEEFPTLKDVVQKDI